VCILLKRFSSAGKRLVVFANDRFETGLLRRPPRVRRVRAKGQNNRVQYSSEDATQNNDWFVYTYRLGTHEAGTEVVPRRRRRAWIEATGKRGESAYLYLYVCIYIIKISIYRKRGKSVCKQKKKK